ncbi:hypothetical protein [Verrucomicrobium spinosum]|uniref:hypothetical protein n=1 Tax=Verrucomicrobium spinosum TaxID=2736 RepID=UPI000946309B
MVVLAGSSTYTGSTSIVRGTVRLGRQDALPTGTLLNVHSSDLTSDLAAFDLAGFNQTVGASQVSNGATPPTPPSGPR